MIVSFILTEIIAVKMRAADTIQIYEKSRTKNDEDKRRTHQKHMPVQSR